MPARGIVARHCRRSFRRRLVQQSRARV
jgi:hypothetical protein